MCVCLGRGRGGEGGGGGAVGLELFSVEVTDIAYVLSQDRCMETAV